VRRRRKREQGGFTLVEVLISLILAAIAMIGVIALYRAQTNASSFSRRNTEATMIAERQLETTRTAAGGTASTTTTVVDETGTLLVGGPFSVTTTIAPIVIGVAPNLIGYDEITVAVTWVEDGGNKTVTLIGRRTTQ
jgi:prepilin-type N-terminal cleavage/methylation domain-containing protein